MRSRLLSILGSLALTAAAAAQSTAFTYQGNLKNAGQPANGLHDFRFALFDAASGGAQVGATQCVDNILISEGLFAATVDFGSQFASASPRFLQVEVRADTGLTCGNLAGFVILGERQPITSAPVAGHAKVASTAFSLSAPDGSPANAVFVDNSGKVGIGTTTPTHSVHVAGPSPALALQDSDGSSTQVGFVSFRDSSNVERAWVGYGAAGDADFSVVNARPGGDIVLNPFSGNVGVGTSAPAAKLDVRGDIRLGPAGQYRAVAGEENLRVIRGTVYTGSGTILYGSGFTVTPVRAGRCTIVFDTPFSDFPTSVAVADNGGSDPTKFVETSGFFRTSSTFQVTQRSNGESVDALISFIIVGPR